MNKVYTPDILQNRAECSAAGLERTVPLFAVFGKPIEHSKSPLMQNAALRQIARADAKYKDAKYFAFEVDAENLEMVLNDFFNYGFIGINLTIPHKEVAFGCVKIFDESAKIAGACNTLARTQEGWKGYNTDGYGLEKAILENFSRSVKGADIALIGAGGAARGTAFYLARRGIKSLTLVNRSAERLEKLSEDLRAENVAHKTFLLSDENFYKAIQPNSIIVNATAIGLKQSDAAVLDFSKISGDCVFFDMPYVGGGETVSVKAASAAGLRAASGLAMLAWQGAKSLSIWTGKDTESLANTMLAALGAAQMGVKSK